MNQRPRRHRKPSASPRTRVHSPKVDDGGRFEARAMNINIHLPKDANLPKVMQRIGDAFDELCERLRLELSMVADEESILAVLLMRWRAEKTE